MGGDNIAALVAMLPNIIGSFKMTNTSGGADAEGVFYQETISNYGVITSPATRPAHVFMDASRCSSIYQNDCNTVRPPSFALLPQIKF